MNLQFRSVGLLQEVAYDSDGDLVVPRRGGDGDTGEGVVIIEHALTTPLQLVAGQGRRNI